MKRYIHINAENSAKGWTGGLYYKRNIIYILLQNEYITTHYSIVVTTFAENRDIFEPLSKYISIVIVKKNSKVNLLKLYFSYNVRFDFPAKNNSIRRLLHVCPIDWIPDFQHCHYPEYFDDKWKADRDKWINEDMNNNIPLVLSSYDCLKDLENYYGKRNNAYVVHFVSYVEPEIRRINHLVELDTLDKYKLENNSFILISNQFWRHKNHIIVFQAIEELLKRGILDKYKFVFTGVPRDNRDPNYYQQLMNYINKDEFKSAVKILGFIDRTEQLVLMKNCKFIIQPSLFEGWGTVLEDAKVLDKRVLLSDIPVHREQKNNKCVLFEPNDACDLANKIIEMNNVDSLDDVNVGLHNMKESAKRYSLEFEKLIRNNSKVRND